MTTNPFGHLPGFWAFWNPHAAACVPVRLAAPGRRAVAPSRYDLDDGWPEAQDAARGALSVPGQSALPDALRGQAFPQRLPKLARERFVPDGCRGERPGCPTVDRLFWNGTPDPVPRSVPENALPTDNHPVFPSDPKPAAGVHNRWLLLLQELHPEGQKVL